MVDIQQDLDPVSQLSQLDQKTPDTPAVLTDEQHADSLASKGTVQMVSPDGVHGTMPRTSVNQALKSGFSFIPGSEDEANYDKYNNAGIAAGLGAASAASFGISDWVARAAGVSPEALRSYRDYSPTATTVGEIGGIAASLLLAPEESLVGAGADLGGSITAKTAKALVNPDASAIVRGIQQVGAGALGSAVEGSLYGLGNVINETALGDTDHIGERLASNMGVGALIGGGLGASGKALTGALTHGISKAAMSESAPKILNNFANYLAERFPEGRIAQKIGQKVGKLTGNDLIDVVGRMSNKDLEDNASKFGGFKNQIVTDSKDLMEKIGSMAEPDLTDLSTATVLPKIQEILKTLPEDLQKTITEAETSNEILDALKAAKDMSPEVKATVEPLLEDPKLFGPYSSNLAKSEMTIEAFKEALGQDTLKKKFEAITAEGLRDPEVIRPFADIIDKAGALESNYNDLVKTSPDFDISKSGVEVLKKQINSDSKKIPNIINQLGLGGGYLTLATAVHHPALAAATLALGYGKKELQSYLGQGLANIERFNNTMTKATQAAVAVSGKEAIAPVVNSLSEERYDKISKDLSYNSNIQHRLDTIHTITQPLSEIAPNTAKSAAATMNRAHQFLESKLIPKSPTAMLDPKTSTPSRSQLATFNRYLGAVEDPLGVLRNVKNGTISHEEIEALKTVYPKMYADMQSHIMSHLAEQKDPSKIPYKNKIALSTFMGMPLTRQLTNMGAANPQQAQQQQTGKRSRSKGLDKIDIATRSETPFQRNQSGKV